MKKEIILIIFGLLIYSPCFAARVDVGGGGGGGTVSDVVYGAGWDGDTTVAPSKNAVYDKIETIASGGDNISVNSTGATNANFLDNLYIDYAIDTAATPDDITSKFNYAETLAGNPALLVDECVLMKDASGGGFICEGSIADTNEQLYRFPDVNGSDTTTYFALTSQVDGTIALGTDTSGNYAAGDAEAGAALTGDSATSFFASGTIEDARLPTSMADKVITGSLAVPQGASPTVDAVGESAVDTTTDQFVYYGGAKRTLPYSKEICVTLETPVDADDNIMFFQPRHAITITDVVCRVDGGTSIPLTISDGTNALEAITCATTATEDDGSIANGTFTALERMEFDLGTPTGTQTWLNFCVTYTVDAD